AERSLEGRLRTLTLGAQRRRTRAPVRLSIELRCAARPRSSERSPSPLSFFLFGVADPTPRTFAPTASARDALAQLNSPALTARPHRAPPAPRRSTRPPPPRPPPAPTAPPPHPTCPRPPPPVPHAPPAPSPAPPTPPLRHPHPITRPPPPRPPHAPAPNPLGPAAPLRPPAPRAPAARPHPAPLNSAALTARPQ